MDINETSDQETGSLAEALGAAFDHIEQGGEAPEAPVLDIDTPEGQDPITNGSVDDVGQVDQSEQAASGQEETRANAGDTSAEGQEFGQEVATQDEPDRTANAPSSWTRETAEKWADLPADVKAEIHRRETDYHRGIEQYQQSAQIAQQVQQVVAPFMQNFQAAGVPPLLAIQHLLGVESALRNGSPQEKAQKVAEIIRDYGIDPSIVQPLPPLDPQVQQLMHQNRQLQQFQQQTVQQQQNAVLSEIEAFKANPENADFEAIKGDMAALLNSGLASSLEEARDKARWMRPDIRKTLVQQQSANAQKQQAEAARRQRAKSAAGGVKGSAPSKTTVQQHDDLRSAIESAMDGDS